MKRLFVLGMSLFLSLNAMASDAPVYLYTMIDGERVIAQLCWSDEFDENAEERNCFAGSENRIEIDPSTLQVTLDGEKVLGTLKSYRSGGIFSGREKKIGAKTIPNDGVLELSDEIGIQAKSERDPRPFRYGDDGWDTLAYYHSSLTIWFTDLTRAEQPVGESFFARDLTTVVVL